MFGERLLMARKQKGLTLEKLADIYNERFNGNLSKGTLSKYENGKQEPMISTVGNLALILDVSVDFLIGDKINNSDNSVVIFNRNGEIIRKKFSEEQMKYLEKFISSLTDEDYPDL